MLNYAIVGFGGLGKNHFNNYFKLCEKAGGVKLVAICDIDESRFYAQTATNLGDSANSLDLSDYTLYTDVDTMLDNEKLDFVITALPTYLHEQIDVKIMKHGIHVFSEKPMAISLEQAENMLKVAKENNVKLMIGQCERYEAHYKTLKEMIVSGRFGKVVRADFSRIAGTPIWGWQNWFCDEAKSGGAPIDLHIHDTDLINWFFGIPDYVVSFATHNKTKFDSITTTYMYGDTVVTARGDWGNPSETYRFNYSFSVRFEKATLEFKNRVVTLYEDDKATDLVMPPINCYLHEVIDFVCCIRDNKTSPVNTPEDSYNSLRIAMAEKESASKNGEKVYLK